ncbi:tetratricopeptide repeat protein [Kordia sp.]|uniref:tetratricopeptide repeat protein n=1 Tax=Kordia sp. TaxID=1965332 RepID=UPI003D6C2DCA
MATYTNDILFIQALDSYSYDLEQCVEKLQYVLGGNDHAGASNLMGRIYHERLHDYKNAREYYHRALCIDHEYVETYYYYPFLLIDVYDYAEAEHVLEVGFSLAQTDKARLHYIKAILLEKQEQFKEAKKHLKKSKHLALNNDYRYFVDNQLQRVNEKMKVGKKSKKKKSKRKNKTTTNVKFNSMLD